MSRKDYVALAGALAKVRKLHPESRARHVWWDTVVNVADVCKAYNSRFDREQFYKACEKGEADA